MEILNSTRATEIAGIVKGLSVEEQDHLMAYIYRGLAHPESGTSAILLSWHERVSAKPQHTAADQDEKLTRWFVLRQLTEAAGTGCIMRVMTDRRDL